MRRVFFTRVSEGLEEDFGGFDSRGFTRVWRRTLEGLVHEGFRGFGGGLWRVWSTRVYKDFGGFGPRGFTRVSKSAGDLKIPPPFWFWFFPAFLVFGFWREMEDFGGFGPRGFTRTLEGLVHEDSRGFQKARAI